MKKYVIIIFILTIIFNMINIFKVENIRENKTYSMQVKVSGSNLEVLKINNKNLNYKVYIKNYEKLNFGYYNIVFFVNKKYNNKLSGEILDYKPQKFNIFREYILKIIEKSYDKYELKAISRVLILGDFSKIYNEDKEMYINLGIYYLIVISGLHISIIIKVLTYFFNFIKLDEILKTSIIYIVLILYITLIGFTPSLLRVFLFYIYRDISKIIFNEKIKLKEAFVDTFLIHISLNVYEIFNLAFIYTYISVFSLIYGNEILKRKIQNIYLKKIFFTILVNLFLLPFYYYYMKYIPLLSIITNLLIADYILFFINILMLNFLFNILGINIFSILVEKIFECLDLVIKFLNYLPFLNIKLENIIFFDYILLLILILFLIYIFYSEI